MISPYTNQFGYAFLTGLDQRFRSGSEGTLRNEGDVRNINGFAVDVTGQNTKAESRTTQAIQPGKGVKTVKPDTAASLLDPSTLAASVALQTTGVTYSQNELRAVMDRSVAGTMFDGMAIAESVEITRTQELAPEQVSGVGFLPYKMGRTEEIAHVEREIARAAELADIERKLSDEFKTRIKMAYDTVSGEYLALRPGQNGYDRVMSAQELLDVTVNRDIQKMGYGKETFRDVLEQYGIKV